MESKELLNRIAQQLPTKTPAHSARPLESPIEQYPAPVFELNWGPLLIGFHNDHEAQTRLAMLAEGIAKQWRASRIAIFDAPIGKPLQILAVSNGLIEDLNEQDKQNLTNAAHEAREQRACVWASFGSGLHNNISECKLVAIAHHQLAKDVSGIVLSIPLGLQGQIQGVLLIEFGLNQHLSIANSWLQHWNESIRAMQAQCVAVASALNLVQSKQTANRFFSNPIQFIKTRLVGRNGLIAGTLLFAAITLVPVSDPVSAPARIEGQIQRQLTAPTNGILKTVYARPGDRVKAGQLIAELKERDFELERSRLQSERAAHEGNYRSSIAKGDRAAMILAQSKVEELDAQLGLIATQLDGIQVRAPIDGIIISTDLSTLVGNSIERGQTLAVVAPENSFRVIIELDERDSMRVKALQKGQLALSARPFESIPIQVDSISPAAIVTESGNAIEVHAKLSKTTSDDQTQFIKPGLRGVVHLDDSSQPLAFIWFRQASHYLRIWAWRWLPWLAS
jgi:multidrug efflux pump subunit AcrA (membrane-fusion protein)